MDIQIGNPNAVYLLSIALLALVLGGYATWARVRAAKKFATANLASQMLPTNQSWRHWMSTALVVSTLGLVALALVDVRWGKTTREVPQKGIEVMFALDVSRSMLAEDVSPNRLGRAKQQIKDMVDEMTGDRVGLVIFAGDTRQSVPLTSHYDDFRQRLDSVGPHSLNRGGSRLGDAIRTAADGFISKTNDHKAIVIFTDGEDQESDPIEAAQTAFTDRGIRIFTVGLGDVEQGALVPVDREDRSGSGGSTYLRYRGETVRSKLNGEILSKLATETEGAYIPAGTRRVDMAEVYRGYISNVQQTEFETAKIDTYIPRFPWFAAPALLLLVIEILVSTRRHRGTVAAVAPRKTTQVAGRAAAVLAAVLATGASRAAEPVVGEIAKQINSANQLVRDGQIDDAITAYEAIPSHEAADLLNYDLGVARYRAGELQTAADLFAMVAGSGDADIAARGRYNLGNCRYAEAIKLAEMEKPAAIEKLKQAIGHYRGSLANDPNHVDARANIELAAKLMRQLQDEQEQQQHDQDKQQQDQKQQSGDGSEGEQPPQDNDQSSSENEQPQEENQQQQRQSPENQQGESSAESKSESEAMNEGQDDSSSSSKQEAKPQPDKSKKNEPASEPEEPPEVHEPSESQPEDSGSTQPTPSGELSTADPSKQDSPSSSSGMAATEELPPGMMTREEALKMLQAVRDRDMIRRLQQERRLQSQRFNVEKDW